MNLIEIQIIGIENTFKSNDEPFRQMAKPQIQPSISKLENKVNREREFESPDRDYQFEDMDRANRERERDYYEQLELSPESRTPDRYGWEQFDRGYYY